MRSISSTSGQRGDDRGVRSTFRQYSSGASFRQFLRFVVRGSAKTVRWSGRLRLASRSSINEIRLDRRLRSRGYKFLRTRFGRSEASTIVCIDQTIRQVHGCDDGSEKIVETRRHGDRYGRFIETRTRRSELGSGVHFMRFFVLVIFCDFVAEMFRI